MPVNHDTAGESLGVEEMLTRDEMIEKCVSVLETSQKADKILFKAVFRLSNQMIIGFSFLLICIIILAVIK